MEMALGIVPSMDLPARGAFYVRLPYPNRLLA